MRIFCRLFGHDVSRRRVQLNHSTFEQHSRCRRCGVPLVRDGDEDWREDDAGE